MYPRQIKKQDKPKQSSTISDFILNKLIREFSTKPIDTELIQCYVHDYSTKYTSFSESCVRALKAEIKEAVKKSQLEKEAIIKSLKQPSNTQQLQNKEDNQNNENNSKQNTKAITQGEEQQKCQSKKNPVEIPRLDSLTSENKQKSVYQLEDDELDEWAAIIKHDSALYQKEQEEKKRREQQLRHKLKDDLDRQLKEKEQIKKEEALKEAQFNYQHQQRKQEFEQYEKQKKEQMKLKQIEERKLRDEQVQQEKHKRRESQKQSKLQDDEMLQQLKNEISRESQELNKKRQEQKDKFQQILKENEQLRHKAQEELKLQKEIDTKLQQQQLQKMIQDDERREQQKRDRDDKIKQFMSNYSHQVLSKQKENEENEGKYMLEQLKKQEEQDKQQQQYKKLKEKEKMELVKQQLQLQIQQKQQKKLSEEEEQKLLLLKQQLDLMNHSQKEKEKQLVTYCSLFQSIKNNYKQNQEDIKKQIEESKNKSAHEKMSNMELLHNKSLLKNIAQEQAVKTKFRKVNVSMK
ncbi:unnamed protein product (macronuclear) [Paramecium tetraurelia]|uniref:Uncharacterized protein n=1 Tax=Paramecium tetraurelia TaxID=5888 RepID=A0DQD5_PARTE|nr:uncharacterized protein GSPATT00002652001 [Paramecium tetraurelia]CAK85252.1 unnamed protein product [Paramecium tetraurelia]|eukprot:XP_001452649.1 hypothetical protein (macronuclear) [Paramecium tetraurelia strain d4-2]